MRKTHGTSQGDGKALSMADFAGCSLPGHKAHLVWYVETLHAMP